jgi:PAS domain S-box-containing protein
MSTERAKIVSSKPAAPTNSTDTLREAEKRFRLIMENVQDFAICVLDPQGRVIDWNKGTERLFGFPAEEVVGEHFSQFYPPEENRAGTPFRELDEAAARGSASNDSWLLRKDGTRFWASGVTTALNDEAGNLQGFVMVVRDASDRKRLEEFLRGKAEQLAQADRCKDDFLAVLSHELRNPLAAATNGIQVLRQTGTKGNLAEETIDMIRRQLKHLTRLVDDLLDVSRIARGQLDLRKEPVNLIDVTTQSIEVCRPALDSLGHEISVSLPSVPLRVEADPARLEQIITNLVTNAARDMNATGHIDLIVERDGEQAVIRVRNSGPGIPPHHLPGVFDIFKQWGGRPNAGGGRLGIGLNLAKQLTEMHGGSIAAQSEAERGSEFIVRLPLMPQQSDTRQAIMPAVAGDRLVRILVIEDNSDVAKSLARMLRLWGHDVRVVRDGSHALGMALQHHPEVVLIDLGLPDVDGYQVAMQFRQDPELKNVRLVALTAYGDEAHQRRAKEAGFDRHLTKPLDPTELRRLLSEEPEPASKVS